MLSAVQAKSIADAQSTGDPVDGSLLEEANTGRQIMDDANHAILWSAMKGRYTAVINLTNYNDAVINQAMSDLITLGYTTDTSRMGGYKELIIAFS